MKEKFKSLILDDRLFYSTVVLVVAIASFSLGRLSVSESVSPNNGVFLMQSETEKGHSFLVEPQETEMYTQGERKEVSDEKVLPPSAQTASVAEGVTPAGLKSETRSGTTQPYVASKSGTKYHLDTCPGAKQIKAENKITFASREEAEAAGFAPAANCPGLK